MLLWRRLSLLVAAALAALFFWANSGIEIKRPITADGISAEQGYAYQVAPATPILLTPLSDDPSNPDRAPTRLFEDGRALHPAHATHDHIRREGRGAFSQWRSAIYFSTSDNSDPRSNGRAYAAHMVAVPSLSAQWLFALCLVAAVAANLDLAARPLWRRLGLLAAAALAVLFYKANGGIEIRRPIAADDISAEEGYAYRVALATPDLLVPLADDVWDPDGAPTELFEDGHALHPAHAPHDRIRKEGRGAFSQWRSEIYFSTSDNSDPRSNGRAYVARLVAVPSLSAQWLLALCLAVAVAANLDFAARMTRGAASRLSNVRGARWLAPRPNRFHALEFYLAALLMVALILFLFHVHASFTRLTEPRVAAIGYGNASAPYSDAMDPWLRGTMSYYLNGTPTANLYRPTIGLFFSTILTVFQAVSAIPKVFIAAFLAAAIYFFVSGPIFLRVIIVGALVTLNLNYDVFVSPLYPECVMMGFWTMSFSLIGLILIGLGQNADRLRWLPAVAGFSLVGIAAAVQGPQLLGGGLVLGWCATRWIRQGEWKTLALSAVALLAPTLGDTSIRMGYGITNNAVANLYCVYADPSHAWTPQTDQLYHLKDPSNQEVLGHFLAFITGPDGRAFLRSAMAYTQKQDALQIRRTGFISLLLVCAAIGWWTNRGDHETPYNPFPGPIRKIRWRDWGIRLCLIGVLVLIYMIVTRPPVALHYPVLILAGVIAVAGILKGCPMAVCFALSYVGSLTLHAVLGVVSGYRVSVTYEIFVFAALVCLLVEPSASGDRNAKLARGLPEFSAIVILIIAIAYAGNFVGRRGQKSHLRAELGETARNVVKVSGDRAIDRSLYFDGKLSYFYTNDDGLPFGSVRTYSAIKAPAGLGLASLITPCEVTWEAKP